MKERISISGLWERETKKGDTYLAGPGIDEERLESLQETIEEGWSFVIFPNGYKEEEKHPDYILYLSPPYEKEKKSKGKKKGFSKGKGFGKKKQRDEQDEIPY